MRRVYWSILLAAAILVVGIIMGIGGLLLAPIIGVVAVVAILAWMAERKAKDKPPLE